MIEFELFGCKISGSNYDEPPVGRPYSVTRYARILSQRGRLVTKRAVRQSSGFELPDFLRARAEPRTDRRGALTPTAFRVSFRHVGFYANYLTIFINQLEIHLRPLGNMDSSTFAN